MRNELSIKQLIAMIRIGHKYNVQHLQNAAKWRLCMLFPTASLQQWRPYEECKQLARVSACHTEREKLCELNDILVLIRDFPELKNLVPLVMYTYCQASTEPLAALVGGTLEDVSAGDCMSGETLNAYLQAIPRLSAQRLEIFSAFADVATRKTCGSRRICDRAVLELLYKAMKQDIASRPCPLEDISPWCAQQTCWPQICMTCRPAQISEVNRLRLAAWNALGTTFNVPTWQFNESLDA